ncbi:hypothetical protein LTS18_013833, partial [Coniosporium uncinatum]
MASSNIAKLQKAYPWIKTPLVCCAPMRMIALAPLTVEVSKAGGIGFLGSGTDTSHLRAHLMQASDLLSENPSTTLPTPNNDDSILPLGVGVLNWGADLKKACAAFKSYTPAAVWFF